MKISAEEFYDKYFNEKSGEFELPDKEIVVSCPIELVLKSIEYFRLEGFLEKAEIEVEEK